MLENSDLKVLDLSYNNIGGTSDLTAVKTWAEAFLRDNKLGLLHFDLSYNKFNREECELIAEALEKNHGIYGFHFRGNFGQITCKGFLKLENEKEIKLELNNNRRGEW